MPMIESSYIVLWESSCCVMVYLQGPNLKLASSDDLYSSGSEAKMMECTFPMKWLRMENYARNSVS